MVFIAGAGFKPVPARHGKHGYFWEPFENYVVRIGLVYQPLPGTKLCRRGEDPCRQPFVAGWWGHWGWTFTISRTPHTGAHAVWYLILCARLRVYRWCPLLRYGRQRRFAKRGQTPDRPYPQTYLFPAWWNDGLSCPWAYDHRGYWKIRRPFFQIRGEDMRAQTKL